MFVTLDRKSIRDETRPEHTHDHPHCGINSPEPRTAVIDSSLNEIVMNVGASETILTAAGITERQFDFYLAGTGGRRVFQVTTQFSCT